MASRQSRLHQYAEEVKTDPAIVSRAIKAMAYIHDQITAAFPALGAGKSDTPLQDGNTAVAVPDQCLFTIKHAGGVAYIQITPPQLRIPLTQKTAKAMTVNNPNSLLGTLVHRVQSCQDQNFSASGGVQIYTGIATSHFSWPDTNVFWRLQSSFDGKNFNDWSAAKQG